MASIDSKCRAHHRSAFISQGKKLTNIMMKLSEQSDFEKSEMLSIYASNTCYSVIMAGTCTALHQESIPDDWAA